MTDGESLTAICPFCEKQYFKKACLHKAIEEIHRLEAENAKLKEAIGAWKKEETLRGGLALKNREEQNHA